MSMLTDCKEIKVRRVEVLREEGIGFAPTWSSLYQRCAVFVHGMLPNAVRGYLDKLLQQGLVFCGTANEFPIDVAQRVAIDAGYDEDVELSCNVFHWMKSDESVLWPCIRDYHFLRPDQTGLKDELLGVYDVVYRLAVGAIMRPKITEKRKIEVTAKHADSVYVFTGAEEQVLVCGHNRVTAVPHRMPTPSRWVAVAEGDVLNITAAQIVEKTTKILPADSNGRVVSVVANTGVGWMDNNGTFLNELLHQGVISFSTKQYVRPSFKGLQCLNFVKEHLPMLLDEAWHAKLKEYVEDVRKGSRDAEEVFRETMGPLLERLAEEKASGRMAATGARKIVLPHVHHLGYFTRESDGEVVFHSVHGYSRCVPMFMARDGGAVELNTMSDEFAKGWKDATGRYPKL